MGLTIHYALSTHLTKPDDVRELVEVLRLFARGLPFAEVSDVVEFRGRDADFERGDRDDPYRWLKIQAQQWVEEGPDHYQIRPTHVVAFAASPGEGCEDANLGLCL